MDPTTTSILTQFQNQSLSSLLKSMFTLQIFNQLQTTLGISHTVFILVIMLFFIPMVTFFTWRVFGSFTMAFIATFGTVLLLTFMGIIPVWICVPSGILTMSIVLMNTFFVGGESKVESTSKKRRVYKNKILCKFIHDNGDIEETWVDQKEQFVEYEFGTDNIGRPRIGKYIIAPSKVAFDHINSRFYPVIHFKVNNPMPIDEEEFKDMVNQLIQDPSKAGIRSTTTAKIMQDFRTTTTSIFPKITDNTLGFKSIGFDRGTKIAIKLDTTHRQIFGIFDNDIFNGANSLVDINKIKGLELDLYNNGIQVLKHVYDLALQLQQSKIDELNNTNKELTDKLGILDKTSPMYKLTSDRLDINNKSLEMIKKYNDAIDELICQVELYIDTISEMCLELPELLNHTAQSDITAKIQEINDRIAMGQRVKSEYVKEGI